MIRPLTPPDIPAIAAIHQISRIESERGIIMDADLARDDISHFLAKWETWSNDPEIHTRIAMENNMIQGFICYGRVKTRPASDRGVVPKFGAEIYALYVHPDHWRKGVATSLFQAACLDLTDKKLTSLLLWVLKKNKRACALYDKFKGERVAKQRVDIGEKSWAEESCFAWRDIRKIALP